MFSSVFTFCFHFLFQSFGSESTPGFGLAGVNEETQELLARVAELQQEKWNLEEKVGFMVLNENPELLILECAHPPHRCSTWNRQDQPWQKM